MGNKVSNYADFGPIIRVHAILSYKNQELIYFEDLGDQEKTFFMLKMKVSVYGSQEFSNSNFISFTVF